MASGPQNLPDESSSSDGESEIAKEKSAEAGQQPNLLQVLNAGTLGWKRPMLATGQLSEHYEPSSLDLLVFSVRFGLRLRNFHWTHAEKIGSMVLDSWDAEEEFATYELSRELKIAPDAGFLLKYLGGSLVRAATWMAGLSFPAEQALLPRPQSRYNRYIYLVLARKISEFSDTFTTLSTRELSETILVNPSMLEEHLTDVRDNILQGGVSWGRIVAAFAWAGAFTYQCMNVEFPYVIDRMLGLFNRLLFVETINPWLANNGGWVC